MSSALLKPLVEYPEYHACGSSPCQRTIGAMIGRELRIHYDLSEPIPDRMLKLLKQLDDAIKPGGSPGAQDDKRGCHV